ncbi:MAG: DUF4271 domain-containing protein [Muribaculaceae bacterium]|nr:DUF4271 domain-containing protein [Muribaculaceae bacterium]
MPSLKTTHNSPDTANIAPDSNAQHYYAPLYPDGFSDSTISSCEVKQLHTLPTMEVTTGIEGAKYNASPAVESGILTLIMCMMLLVCVAFGRDYKYLFQLLRNPFSFRLRENAFEDSTIKETFTLVVLIATNCITQGILLFYALGHLGAIHSYGEGALLSAVICIAVSTFYYTFQLLLYRVLGYVFGSKEETTIWIAGYNSTQSLLALGYIFLCLLLITNHNYVTNILICALILYILLRILFIYKGFRIFFNRFQDILYFILYLCAVEIVPVILSISGAILICNIVLQS